MLDLPTLFLALSPFTLLEATIDPNVFPKEAPYWERIGLFQLKDGDKDRFVLLYAADSDFVSEKMWGSPTRRTPNLLELHALYPMEDGRWVHAKPLSGTRSRFGKVVSATNTNIVVEIRGNFPVRLDLRGDLKKQLERAREINRPFIASIHFKDGRLTAK